MRVFLAVSLVALAVGCSAVRSIHPLYDDKTLVYDSSLEGIWRDTGSGGDTFLVRPYGSGAPNAYDVAILGKEDDSSRFLVRLVQIGDTRFLDIAEAGDAYLSIDAHLFARIDVRGMRAEVRILDPNWVKHVASQEGSPAYLPLESSGPGGGGILLVGPTLELQRFLERHADDDEAYEDADVLERVPWGLCW